MPEIKYTYTFHSDVTPHALVEELCALKVAILTLALSHGKGHALEVSQSLKSTGLGKLIEIAEQIEAAAAKL
ncbi:hypothetical protein ABCT85_001319 [Klebsiella aerogenes]